MTMHESFELVAGAPLVAIVPALVELAKRQGMPVRYAGIAAIGIAVTLLGLAESRPIQPPSLADLARWTVAGIVYGLAAAGLYSQWDVLSGRQPSTGQAE